jgi:PKHD-type hydroxylase
MDTMLSNNAEPLTRKLSVTLLLNDNFDGGQFEFFDLEKEHQPKMTAGTLIVFPSFMVHRVTEITKGVRNSLVCWCVGPKFK